MANLAHRGRGPELTSANRMLVHMGSPVGAAARRSLPASARHEVTQAVADPIGTWPYRGFACWWVGCRLVEVGSLGVVRGCVVCWIGADGGLACWWVGCRLAELGSPWDRSGAGVVYRNGTDRGFACRRWAGVDQSEWAQDGSDQGQPGADNRSFGSCPNLRVHNQTDHQARHHPTTPSVGNVRQRETHRRGTDHRTTQKAQT
jgi:hypothetical protein